jgi:hypothetical protein
LSALHLLNVIAVPTMLHIGGAAIPSKDAFNVLEDFSTSIVKRESIPKAIERLGPDIIPILLTVSGTAIPYAGVAITAVVLMMKYAKPPTPQDQQRMWDQAQGIH